MNRLLYILTMTAVTMTAVNCTSDTVSPVPTEGEGQAVGFTANVLNTEDAKTRAAYTGAGVLTTELLKTTGFGAYCWYTGSTDFDNWAGAKDHIGDYLGSTGYMLMRNQKVEWKDWGNGEEQWGYTPAKYWPLKTDEKLTFRAYAPYVNYQLITNPDEVADRGTPYLPVVVQADDFCNDRQHDPLWGTSNYVDGIHDTEHDSKYGTPYDNFTYTKSGNELTTDLRDGTIDWYFHHGMAMFALQAAVAELEPGTEVRFKSIHAGPYYNEGLLDIFGSPTASASEKPIWRDRSGDIYVDLAYEHLNDPSDDPADPEHGTHNDVLNIVLNKTYQNVAVNGLLAIPRDYSVGEGMQLTVTYTTQVGSAEPTEHKATAYLKRNVEGNTVYWMQLLLNTQENTLYIADFVNLDWQVGSYGKEEIE